MSGLNTPHIRSGATTALPRSGRNSPRPMSFVSPISDTNIREQGDKNQNPLHLAAQYLKNAVTLESKDDEKERESMITERKHVNDHGGRQAEADFWEKHSKTRSGAATPNKTKDGKAPPIVTAEQVSKALEQ